MASAKGNKNEQIVRRCPPLPTPPNEEVLKSGVAILTGGTDALGLPLITFPPGRHPKLQNTSPADLSSLIKYYISLTKGSLRLQGFVFLVDLKLANETVFGIIVQTLETLQKENRGCVAVVYIIEPKSKTSLKALRKLLGVRKKKKKTFNLFRKTSGTLEIQSANSCIFKSVFITAPADLYRYFDRHQLTYDFGGTLIYSHDSWIKVRQSFESLCNEIEVVLNNVPATQDKIEMLAEYDIPDDQTELENLLGLIQNRYHDVMRELRIEEVIDNCRAMVEKCNNPERFMIYRDLAQSSILEECSTVIEKQHKLLVVERNTLLESWQKAEGRLKGASGIRQLKEKAQKSTAWIEDIGIPKLKQQIEMADNLSQAELNKNNFESSFYSIGKEVCAEAEKLIEDMYKIAMDNTTPVLQNSLDYIQGFQKHVTEFKLLLENTYRSYIDLYHFFLLTSKVQKWYQRTMKFLPTEYLPYYMDYELHDLLPLNEDWNDSVSSFLTRHPAPRIEHLQKIKEGIPLIKNMRSRNQIRLLIHRVGLLHNLLIDGKITVSDYRQLLQLKDKIVQGYDDLNSSLQRSLPDLSRHRKRSKALSGRPITLDRPRMGSSRPELHIHKTQSYHSLLEPNYANQHIFDRGLSSPEIPENFSVFEPSADEIKKHSLSGRMKTLRHTSSTSSSDLMSPNIDPRYLKSQSLATPLNYQDTKRRGRNSFGKYTPGRRFVKNRDQRSGGSTSSQNQGDVNENLLDTLGSKGKRTFSFHRSPIDIKDYGFLHDSDNCDGSVFSSGSSAMHQVPERYVSLSLPPDDSIPYEDDFRRQNASSLPYNRTRANKNVLHWTKSNSVSSNKYNPLYSSMPNLNPDVLSDEEIHRLSLTQENIDQIFSSPALSPSDRLDKVSEMMGVHNDPMNKQLTPEEELMVQRILDNQEIEKRRQEKYKQEALRRMNQQFKSSPAIYSPTNNISDKQETLSEDSWSWESEITDTDTESDDDITESETTEWDMESESNANRYPPTKPKVDWPPTENRRAPSPPPNIRRFDPELDAINNHRDETLRILQNKKRLLVQNGKPPSIKQISDVSEDERSVSPLGFTLQRLKEGAANSKSKVGPRGIRMGTVTSKESGVYGQTDSDATSETNSSSATVKTETDRGYYGNSASEIYGPIMRVKRLDAPTAPSATDSGFKEQQISDGELENLKEIEKIDKKLQEHSFLERHAFIEQSRNRMLQDLIAMDSTAPSDEAFLF